MNRRWILLIMVILSGISLVGCRKDNGTPNEQTPTIKQTQTTETTILTNETTVPHEPERELDINDNNENPHVGYDASATEEMETVTEIESTSAEEYIKEEKETVAEVERTASAEHMAEEKESIAETKNTPPAGIVKEEQEKDAPIVENAYSSDNTPNELGTRYELLERE